MLKYILKRILMMIPVMIGVALITFSMMHLSPGEPADFVLGELATEEDKELFNEQNGLNDPFIVQFGRYIFNACRGDLGTSYSTRQPVMDMILSAFPTTMKLSLYAELFAIVLGITLGVISAVKQYSFIDNLTRVLAMIGVSLPSFWEGLMLIILFSVVLGWLPPSGLATPSSWILPAFTLSTWGLAACMRMTRSSMLEAIREDYVRTARAKGQREFVVIMKHAFRNAVLPIITVAGTDFAKLLGGAAVIETVFSINGVGKMIVDGINTKDAPLVQGGILFVALAMSIINLLIDLLYAFIDPRIRSKYQGNRNRTKKHMAKAVPEKVVS
ncbi:MAG: ABC transporter permease [Eubacterium sp.]|jgi:peptide/nickel transport system permease protein